MRSLLQKIEQTHVLYLATFLFFLACIAYINTLGNTLFFDDEDFIYNNHYVQQFSLADFFTKNLIAGAGKVSNYYRPMLAITYGLEYQLVGSHGTLYHITSLLFHIAAGISLFLVLRRLLSGNFVPFVTTILFLIHPVQTEAVAYVSGRSDPMSVFFMMITILFFFKETLSARTISVGTFIAALLTRETAIVLPALLLLIILFQTKSITQTVKKIHTIVPYAAVAIIYFLLRLTILNFHNTLNFFSSETPYSTTIAYRMLTFFSILPEYMGLLIYPKTLNIERNIKVVTTVTPIIALVFTTLILLFIAAVLVRKKYPLFLFSFVWFFVTIAPTMGFIPINGIMYEHFLYLPLIGVFLPFTWLLWKTIKRCKTVGVFLFCFMSLWTSSLFLRTISRNADWHDPITFYTKTIAVNSRSPRIYNNLAMSYAQEGKHKEAVAAYTAALRISDTYPETHYNLGNSYVALNELGKAESEYLRSLSINPYFLRSYTNLVSLYTFLGKQSEKEAIIQKVILLSEENEELKPFVRYLQSI